MGETWDRRDVHRSFFAHNENLLVQQEGDKASFLASESMVSRSKPLFAASHISGLLHPRLRQIHRASLAATSTKRYPPMMPTVHIQSPFFRSTNRSKKVNQNINTTATRIMTFRITLPPGNLGTGNPGADGTFTDSSAPSGNLLVQKQSDNASFLANESMPFDTFDAWADSHAWWLSMFRIMLRSGATAGKSFLAAIWIELHN